MRCIICQKLGLTKNHCSNPPACASCNLLPHDNATCSRTSCANCELSDHAFSSKTCPQFIQTKEILKIKTQKCSLREATKIYNNQFKSDVGDSPSYSSIASQHEVNNPQPTNSNNKQNKV